LPAGCSGSAYADAEVMSTTVPPPRAIIAGRSSWFSTSGAIRLPASCFSISSIGVSRKRSMWPGPT
jgi:hypothetical protein